MLRVTYSLILSFTLISSYAQNESLATKTDKQLVMKAVDNMFDAMRESDSSKLSKIFHPELEMYSSYVTNGEVILHKGSSTSFLEAVGKEKTDIWDEKIENVTIKIDDNLAQVWMDYYFFLNDQFLHCGVNFMTLTKTDIGWQIFHLADTRKKGACTVPDHLK